MSATLPLDALAQAADELVGETAALRDLVREDAPAGDPRDPRDPGHPPIHVDTLGEDAATLHVAACELRGALPDVALATERFLDADACLHAIDEHERMRALDEVLLPRGGGWHPWIAVLRDELRRCRLAVRRVANALIRAWRACSPTAAGMHDHPRRSE